MKISKHSFLIGSFLSLTSSVIHASSPLIQVGDNVNILFDGSSSLVWQSNLFYDDDTEEDELMLLISPGFEASVGNRLSVFNAYLAAHYEMQRFDKQSRLNDDYLHLKSVASYRGARLDVNAEYSFDEEQTTAGEQGASIADSNFIELDVTNARLSGVYTLSPKLSFEPGVRYHDRDFKDEENRLADVELYSIPLDIFYELTPKVDISFGYEYTFEEVGVSAVEDFHRESHYLNIGARGDLLPKLNGFFKVGYSSVNPEGSTRDTDNILGFNTDFTYLATPKLTAQLLLFRGFQVGSEGQSAENTSANLALNYNITDNYAARLFSNISYWDFKDGNDGQDFIYRSGFRFSYIPNQFWNFSTGYTYMENDSNRLEQGYVNHILDVSAALRY